MLKKSPILLQKTKLLFESKRTWIVNDIDTKLARVCNGEVGDREVQTFLRKFWRI